MVMAVSASAAGAAAMAGSESSTAAVVASAMACGRMAGTRDRALCLDMAKNPGVTNCDCVRTAARRRMHDTANGRRIYPAEPDHRAVPDGQAAPEGCAGFRTLVSRESDDRGRIGPV